MTETHVCDRCGQTHAKCSGHRQDGKPCGQIPMRGQRVCRKHGGKSPQALAAAERRLARMEIQETVHAALGDRPDKDEDPIASMQWLINWSAAHCRWYLAELRKLRPDALIWGDTEVRESDSAGLTLIQKAAVHALLRLYNEERDRLAGYCALAIRNGLHEREIRLAEERGALIADIIRACLARLELTPDQQAMALTVVPDELRRAAGNPSLN